MMANYSEILEDTFLTADSVLNDLENMQEYYQDMSVESQIYKESDGFPAPMLVAQLDNDDKGRTRVITNSLVPLDKESAEFTKYVQYYTELPNDLSKIKREDILEAVNVLNAKIPVGNCILVEGRPELELPCKIGVRLIHGFPLNFQIDQGVFSENVFLYESSCELISAVLDALAEGKTLQEAYEVLQ